MNKIKALQEEAIRLIGLQQSLLQQIKEKVPADATYAAQARECERKGEETIGQFTPAAIDRKLRALEENLIKTRTLEMVLAVVGTMKAGKSTCINAIVGQEILPNRNRPMTALPTLIRHKAGVTTPVLNFDGAKQRPVLALVKNMQKLLAKKDYRGWDRIESDSDLFALAKIISSQAGAGYKLSPRYEGERGIFDFLKGLNDLVRLAKELGLPFPFESYTSIADFPEIEVEFFHLRDQVGDGALGSFCLLDTPGFNEAGQAEHLLPMLKVQLEKASAVLAVLDYTQLKSESEAILRQELEEIAGYSGERMFCLVNKFDQNNSNSDNEDETSAYVAHNLLDKAFGAKVKAVSRIFPVSGQYAYLAKRAELQVIRHGGLGWKEGQPESWVDTFGKEAMGLGYRRRINDNEEVSEGVAELWKASRFDVPLTNVITYSHGNAARIAIQAATAKLEEIAGEDGDSARGIGAMLTLRLQTMDLAGEKIDLLIDELQTKLIGLEFLRKSASSKLGELVSNIGESMKASVKAVRAEMAKTIKDAFDANLEKQAVEAEADEAARKTKRTGQGKKVEKPEKVHLDIRDEMEFASIKDAKKCLDSIARDIKKSLDKSAESLLAELIASADSFRDEVKQLSVAIANDIAEFEEHATEVGLEGLKIRLPNITNIALELDSGDEGDSLVTDTTYQKTRLKDRDTTGGKIKRFFGFFFGQQEWGRDAYQVTIERYSFKKVDLENLYRGVVVRFGETLADISKRKFAEPMEANKEAFFANVSEAFDTISESLDASRHDQQKSRERQEEIRAVLHALLQEHKKSIDDIRHLKRNVTKLISA